MILLKFRYKLFAMGKNHLGLSTPLPVEGSQGYFYVIQLIPEHTPFRLKVGWTTDLRKRLSQIRTICPKAVLLHWWECQKPDEQNVIDFIDNNLFVFHLSREVIDLPALDSSLGSLIMQIEEFFDAKAS